jgi:hypothetical protein
MSFHLDAFVCLFVAGDSGGLVVSSIFQELALVCAFNTVHNVTLTSSSIPPSPPSHTSTPVNINHIESLTNISYPGITLPAVRSLLRNLLKILGKTNMGCLFVCLFVRSFVRVDIFWD